MTDFIGLIEAGIEVAAGSNYAVLLAARELSWDNLRENIGVHFLGAYWLIYSLLLMLLVFADRRFVHS